MKEISGREFAARTAVLPPLRGGKPGAERGGGAVVFLR